MYQVKVKNLYKLYTKEDSFHFHKTCGIICLIHFLLRMWFWIKYGNMLFNHSIMTPISMLPHYFLSLSSLQFSISSNRNRLHPIMYPEFRIHSVLFALRSIVIVIIMWENKYQFLRSFIVIIIMICADLTSKHFEENNGTTIRDMPNHFIYDKYMRLFFSVSQIYGTAQCIWSTKIDQVFIILIPIQIGAFLKTLAKKNIITTNGVNFYYTLLLLSNYIYSRTTNLPELGHLNGYWKHSIVFIVCVLRLYYNVNKYFLWGIVIIFYFSTM